MDFTIITANLNGGRFLGECLGSVARQEGVEVEHLVVDGGSVDASAGLVAAHPHARWIPQPGSSISEAINSGFAQARGKWVIWLNSDDRLKNRALAFVRQAVAQLESADVVYGGFDLIGPGGERIRRVNPSSWCPFVSVHHECQIPSTACFFRRRTVMDEDFRLRPDFHCVMDGEFYLRLHAAGKKLVFLPMALADFRLHDANVSRRFLSCGRDLDKVLEVERQHVESRSLRRVYGVTLFRDPYLNGLVDGMLWLAAKGWKGLRKIFSRPLRSVDEASETEFRAS